MKQLILMCLVLVFGFSQAAVSADTIKQQGGWSMVKKIGPWYVFKANYEDGSVTCEVVNFNYQNRPPTFMFGSSKGGESDGYYLRFESKTKPNGNETADVIIGNKSFRFQHPAQYAHNGFFPTSGRDGGQIIELLKAQEKSDRKYFHVRDVRQKLYKFDARSTSKAFDYIEEKCAVN